jgi:hypothetical protein
LLRNSENLKSSEIEHTSTVNDTLLSPQNCQKTKELNCFKSRKLFNFYKENWKVPLELLETCQIVFNKKLAHAEFGFKDFATKTRLQSNFQVNGSDAKSNWLHLSTPTSFFC